MTRDDADSPPASRTRRLVRAGWLALIVLGAGYAGRDLLLGRPVDVYIATEAPLRQTVVATGRVMTPQRVSVAAETTGRVARIPVAEGQSVHAGDLLIALEDDDERAGVAQAEAAVMQAEARIRQINELVSPAAGHALAQAVANAAQARRQLERVRDLQAQGFVGMAQLDDARRNVEVADSQVAAARLQVESNRPGGSDSALARAARAQARANLQLAQTRLRQDRIVAPADGTLIARDVEVGDIVQPGKPLMQLAAAGETRLVVQIDEKNLARLALGQPAIASADAFPDRRFAAELSYINPGIDAASGSVEVKLRVPDPPPYLRQDMTVSVDIEVAGKAHALVIPTDAVHDLTGRAPWVLVVHDGRAVRRPVRLGLVGDGELEVVAGLAAGDAVVPAAHAAVVAGERVRARSAAPPLRASVAPQGRT